MIVLRCAVENSFGVALDGGQGRAEFVRDVGDEIAPGFFHTLGLGEIAQHSHCSAPRHGSRGDVKGPAGDDGDRTGRGHGVFLGSSLNGGQKVGVANAVNDGRVQTVRRWEKTVHAAICPLDAAVGADRDHGILHAIQQSFEFALTGLHAREAFFQTASSLVESGRYLPDFVAGRGGDPGGKVSARNTLGKSHNPAQAPGDVLGSRGCHNHGKQERGQRSPTQRSHNRVAGGLDLRERIGESYRASGDRSGHIQERNANREAGALVYSEFTA